MGRIGVKSWQYYEQLEDVFSVEYKEASGTSNVAIHKHDQYELLLALSDGMFLQVEEDVYDIRKNTLLIFNNMDLHYFGTKEEGGENKRYVLYFNPSYIDFLSTDKVSLLDCFLFRPFARGQILELSEKQTQELKGQMDRLLSVVGKSDAECYGKELYIQLLLAEILLSVNTMYRNYHKIGTEIEDSGRERVYDIVSYIHTHYEDELTLDFLSRKFFINKFYLCEMFRDVVGTTPNQYVLNCRISKAKELLMDGATVEDTCGKSGFNTLANFSRTFKKRVGMSPKKYQLKMRGRESEKTDTE